MSCEPHTDLMATLPELRSPAEQLRLREHLAGCAACRRLEERLRLGIEVAGRVPAAPAGSLERFLAQRQTCGVERVGGAEAAWGSRVAPPVLPAAAPRAPSLGRSSTARWGSAGAAALAAAALLLLRPDVDPVPAEAPADTLRARGGGDVAAGWVELSASRFRPGDRPRRARSGDALAPGEGLHLLARVPGAGWVSLYERDPSGRFTQLGAWRQDDPAGGEVGPGFDGRDLYVPGPDPGRYAFIAVYSRAPLPSRAEVWIDAQRPRRDGSLILAGDPGAPIWFDTLELTLSTWEDLPR